MPVAPCVHAAVEHLRQIETRQQGDDIGPLAQGDGVVSQRLAQQDDSRTLPG